jgi:hypothetical protein
LYKRRTSKVVVPLDTRHSWLPRTQEHSSIPQFLNWRTYENVLFASYNLYCSAESCNQTRSDQRTGAVFISKYIGFCRVSLFHNLLVSSLLAITGD